MSIKVMNLVWEHSQAQHGPLLVLLAIADFADEKGQAFPSIGTLLRKARLSERATHNAITELQRLGELEVKVGKGWSGANYFRVRTENLHERPEKGGADSAPPTETAAQEEQGGVQNLHRGGADSATNPPQNLHPNRYRTVIEPSLLSPTSGQDAQNALDVDALVQAATVAAAAPPAKYSRAKPTGDAGFDEFFAAYPRSEDKQDALKAWGRMEQAEKDAALAYVANPLFRAAVQRKIDAGEGEYIPYAVRWLKNKRWTVPLQNNVPRPSSQNKVIQGPRISELRGFGQSPQKAPRPASTGQGDSKKQASRLEGQGNVPPPAPKPASAEQLKRMDDYVATYGKGARL